MKSYQFFLSVYILFMISIIIAGEAYGDDSISPFYKVTNSNDHSSFFIDDENFHQQSNNVENTNETNTLMRPMRDLTVHIIGSEVPSNIEMNGTEIIEFSIENSQKSNDTFILSVPNIPEGWDVELISSTGWIFSLEANETVVQKLRINSSANPLLSKGYCRYPIMLLVESTTTDEVNDTLIHQLMVEPLSFHQISLEGNSSAIGKPTEHLIFNLEVVNNGNMKSTFIPETLEPFSLYAAFNISYLILEIGEKQNFHLAFTVPNFSPEAEIEIQVQAKDQPCQSVKLILRVYEYNNISCDISHAISGKPGQQLQIPLMIYNNGNIPENITISSSSTRLGLNSTIGNVLIQTKENERFIMKVQLPEDSLCGEKIPIIVNLSINSSENGNILSFFKFAITIEDVPDISLTIVDMTIIPNKHYTEYRHTIEVRNSGNSNHSFSFRAEGTHPQYMIIPPTIYLKISSTYHINVVTLVPLTTICIIDNFLTPFDEDKDFQDINLRILAYNSHLEYSIIREQDEDLYVYNVTILNNCSRTESYDISVNMPHVEDYKPGDRQWQGTVDTNYITIWPNKIMQFSMSVSTPNCQEYWGSDLQLILKSKTSETTKISLKKPPLAIITATLPEIITYEDNLIFTGSQSKWNILDFQWDFGDGIYSKGTTVSHSYSRSGTHIVTLTVIDEHGFSARADLSILVVNTPPNPFIISSPLNHTIFIGERIILDGSHSFDRDGEIVEFRWECDDKQSCEWQTLQETFEKSGDFIITLTVKDNMGGTSNVTEIIHVIEPEESGVNNTEEKSQKESVLSRFSYVPLIGNVIVLILGGIIIAQKRQFINHVKQKIIENVKDDEKAISMQSKNK